MSLQRINTGREIGIVLFVHLVIKHRFLTFRKHLKLSYLRCGGISKCYNWASKALMLSAALSAHVVASEAKHSKQTSRQSRHHSQLTESNIN